MGRKKRDEKSNKTEHCMLYFTAYEIEELENHPKRRKGEKFNLFIKRLISEASDIYIS
jgi:hypothetical protein